MIGRRYDDPCGIARALDLIGDRWALLVVRELIHGPKRFTDLRHDLRGISPNVLSQRLSGLAEQRVLRRRRLGPPASTDVYELTALGAALEPVLLALAVWGSRAIPPTGGELSDDAFVLALRTTVAPSCPNGRYVLDMVIDQFTLTVADGSMSSVRGMADEAVATIRGHAADVRSVVFGGRSARQAVADGDLIVAGDESAGIAFLESFERPTLIDTNRTDQ